MKSGELLNRLAMHLVGLAAVLQTSRAPALPCRSSESETIRNRPIPLRPWYPVAVNLNALVALRRPSCVFVDHSFFGCFRQVAPLPPTTGQNIRVGNKLCFKKIVAKSHGFNWFHGLRRPGRQSCFRQAQSVRQMLARPRNHPLSTLHSPLFTLHSPLFPRPASSNVRSARWRRRSRCPRV